MAGQIHKCKKCGREGTMLLIHVACDYCDPVNRVPEPFHQFQERAERYRDAKANPTPSVTYMTVSICGSKIALAEITNGLITNVYWKSDYPTIGVQALKTGHPSDVKEWHGLAPTATTAQGRCCPPSDYTFAPYAPTSVVKYYYDCGAYIRVTDGLITAATFGGTLTSLKQDPDQHRYNPWHGLPKDASKPHPSFVGQCDCPDMYSWEEVTP